MMPQPAPRVDPTPILWRNEMLVDVELMNLDSTSIKQITAECEGHIDRIKDRIFAIVRERGKMHNPVTRSGGVLVGRVSEIGPDYPARGVKIGDRICPIVSM